MHRSFEYYINKLTMLVECRGKRRSNRTFHLTEGALEAAVKSHLATNFYFLNSFSYSQSSLVGKTGTKIFTNFTKNTTCGPPTNANGCAVLSPTRAVFTHACDIAFLSLANIDERFFTTAC